MSRLEPILNVCLSRSWGGLEMQAVRWARNLSARGHEVHTAVPRGSRLSEELEAAGLSRIAVPYLTRYFDPRASATLRAFIKRRGIGIVQTHHSKDLWIIWPALAGRKGPRLFYVSRILFRTTTKRDPLHRLIYSKLTGVITLTDIGKRCFVAGTHVPADRVRVIPNGFDPALYDLAPAVRQEVRVELGIGDDQVAIGCTSRLDPQKGQYELLEAFRSLAGHFSHLRLVIVGEPTHGEGQPYLDFLTRKTAEYGMEESVTFTGFRDDLPRILQALDVLVLPTYEETFGNSLVEAMLSGLACIGTDAGGPPEVLEGGKVGLLVEPRSVESLARGLRTLIENAGLRQDLGRKARVSARERFDLDSVLGRIENFYLAT